MKVDPQNDNLWEYQDKCVCDGCADLEVFNVTEDTPLDFLIERALPDLRQLVWHSDGRITARTGGDRSVHPKKLYAAKTVRIVLGKLIKDKRPSATKETT